MTDSIVDAVVKGAEGGKTKMVMFDKDIGNIGEDTFVGVNFGHSWTVCIYERYHKFSELDVEEVDKFIRLLEKAKSVVIKERKQWGCKRME
jgi:hypothetical protein